MRRPRSAPDTEDHVVANAFCAASMAAPTSALDASGMVAKTSRVYGFVASRRRSRSASSSLPPMSIWYRVIQRLPSHPAEPPSTEPQYIRGDQAVNGAARSLALRRHALAG